MSTECIAPPYQKKLKCTTHIATVYTFREMISTLVLVYGNYYCSIIKLSIPVLFYNQTIDNDKITVCNLKRFSLYSL